MKQLGIILKNFHKVFLILTNDEKNNLRSKILTSSQISRYGDRRYNTKVFIKQGAAMF